MQFPPKLLDLWQESKEHYKKAEVGSTGNEGFVKSFIEQIFKLKENNSQKALPGTFRNQLKTGENNRTADFVLYSPDNISIPVEVEKVGKTKDGAKQLLNYQLDFNTSYGILTDGKIWRFFTSTTRYVEKDLEEDIIRDFSGFLTFWNEYTSSNTFYKAYFNGELSENLFNESIKPKVNEERERYFMRTTRLVTEFKHKLIGKGITITSDIFENEDKKATELAYSYLIQFILFKTLVDNKYLEVEYADYLSLLKEGINNQSYENVPKVIKKITDTVGNRIYKPFFQDQEDINKSIYKLLESLEKLEIDEVSLFLDIIIYIDSFDFSGLGGDIFGYIYENFLKELYKDENLGQYFTHPSIAELMLDEMGWTVENLTQKLKNKEFDKLSLIDPACGSGTFIYSATRVLIKAGQKAQLDNSKIIQLVVDNIVGFDVEEFPLYLAEMNILMRLLPLIYEDQDNPNPVEERLKIFWTEDSLSEFIDIYKANSEYQKEQDNAQVSLFKPAISQQKRFMRDEKQLEKLKKDLLDIKRKKFDYVIANPPYIGYNECCKLKIKYFQLMKEFKPELKVSLNNVFGVNLHSTPTRHKKYAPKPNLYAFFLALNNALLKDNGRFCFIIPQSTLTNNDLDVIRYFISKKFQIQKLINFRNNLFINRGLKQKKKVATSSLIIVADKCSSENKVSIINYKDSEATAEQTKQDLISLANCEINEIYQIELIEKYENWNWTKHSQVDLEFYQKYILNSENLEIYYNHEKAERLFGERFWFDGGSKIEQNSVTVENKTENWKVLNRKKTSFYKFLITPIFSGYYDKKAKIEFPQGSQGIEIFSPRYKIYGIRFLGEAIIFTHSLTKKICFCQTIKLCLFLVIISTNYFIYLVS